MEKEIERPKIVKDEHLVYLDECRESGLINMFSAGAYLRSHFVLSKDDASSILLYWMGTFSERNPA
jgi:hypothetical protein